MDLTRIHAQIPRYLKERIETDAKENRRTFTAQLVMYIELGLEKKGDGNK